MRIYIYIFLGLFLRFCCEEEMTSDEILMIYIRLYYFILFFRILFCFWKNIIWLNGMIDFEIAESKINLERY